MQNKIDLWERLNVFECPEPSIERGWRILNKFVILDSNLYSNPISPKTFSGRPAGPSEGRIKDSSSEEKSCLISALPKLFYSRVSQRWIILYDFHHHAPPPPGGLHERHQFVSNSSAIEVYSQKHFHLLSNFLSVGVGMLSIAQCIHPSGLVHRVDFTWNSQKIKYCWKLFGMAMAQQNRISWARSLSSAINQQQPASCPTYSLWYGFLKIYFQA